MKALRIYAGPRAMAQLSQQGLHSVDVAAIAAAAGGPKGLILGPLDRFVFGQWLAQSNQVVDLVGASIGAWRMATACLPEPVAALERLEHDYIQQNYALLPGEKRPSPARVSALFRDNLQAFYAGQVSQVLQHPRYRLHVLTSHGRGLLAREQGWGTVMGYGGAFLSNLLSRRLLGAWLERVVFSSQMTGLGGHSAGLPFDSRDYPTRQVNLTGVNFHAALQASCSIPFVLQGVHGIAGAPPGVYWDGGVTDYHLHLNWASESHNALQSVAADACHTLPEEGKCSQASLVLYPHFQKSVVPGWLDKHLRWRHHASGFLDTMVLLAPDPHWVKTLPNGKLPDRTDFTHYGTDLAARVKAWRGAVSASQQLADEFAAWLRRPDMAQVSAL
ncbi:hypothetical protein GALL_461920 [mine drainage metagenome]|uniref:Phospholipase n=1 Tax=mine drainage metagenome TaxID=410659 RepID=A0A1J5PLZ4_9ZZZZ